MTGREEIWASLKLVVGLLVEGDIPTAQGILDAAAITVPTGDLFNGAYDEVGNLYQIPEHIINDPDNVVIDAQDEFTKGGDNEEVTDEDEIERRREEKGKAVIKSEDMLKVKARLSDRGGPDITVSVGKDQSVRVLIQRIQEEANVKTCSLFFSWSITDTNPDPRERQNQDSLPWQDLERGRDFASARMARRACY